jgi:hypothetical protein
VQVIEHTRSGAEDFGLLLTYNCFTSVPGHNGPLRNPARESRAIETEWDAVRVQSVEQSHSRRIHVPSYDDLPDSPGLTAGEVPVRVACLGEVSDREVG